MRWSKPQFITYSNPGGSAASAGGATAANQVEEIAVLNNIDADIISFKTANHSDLLAIDSDISSFLNQNHSDLTNLDNDLNSFAAQNHTDLVNLSTDINAVGNDLNSFALQNNIDLTQIDTDINNCCSQTNGNLLQIINNTGSGGTLDLDLQNIQLTLNNLYTIFSDVWDMADHAIRTHAV